MLCDRNAARADRYKPSDSCAMRALADDEEGDDYEAAFNLIQFCDQDRERDLCSSFPAFDGKKQFETDQQRFSLFNLDPDML